MKRHFTGADFRLLLPWQAEISFRKLIMLSNEQIKKFQKIWRQRFGREIPDEDVDREGSRLVRIVQLICKPTAASEGDEIKKRRNKK